MANKKQDFSQFGSVKPVQSGDPSHCAQCEAMLTDALDGTLSAADQAMFDLHLLSCVTCAGMLADAQRGADWLEMLKSPRPEPPATLLERILAQTSAGTSHVTAHNAAAAIVPATPNTLLGGPVLLPSRPEYSPTNVLPFHRRLATSINFRQIGHTLLQPRLAMTAAMAFFSLALTLNLTGVKISQFRLSDLKPSSIQRSFAQANAHVVRYYDNLRVVYELESRVHDLQSSSESDSSGQNNSTPAKQAPKAPEAKPSGGQQPAQQPSQQPDQQDQDKPSKPRPRSGTSRREDPRGALRYTVAGNQQPSSGTLKNPSPFPLAEQFTVQTIATLFPRVTGTNKASPITSSIKEGKLV